MRTITLFILALLPALCSFSQTYYYLETKTFYEEGDTYQCDVKNGIVTLYNKENKLTYEDNIDKRTGRIYVPNGKGPHTTLEDWTKPKCYSIVNQAFSPKQKAMVAGNELIIYLCISPETGKIMEVNFNMLPISKDPFTAVPVSVFRQIEVELKKHVWFVPTAEGKNMSYILLCWSQDPNETIKASSKIPLDPVDPAGGEKGDIDDNPIRGDDDSVVPL